MTNGVHEKRIETLRKGVAELSEGRYDTSWIIQPENRRYLSGFRAEDSQLTESSGSLLINGVDRLLVTDSRYTLEAEREAVDFEVHTLKQGLTEDLPELLTRIGARNLGFEEDYLTWGIHRKITERLDGLSPPVYLLPSRGVVEQMREVKDEYELKALEDAADLISEILDEVIVGLKPGMTEREVAWKVEGLARDAGAEALSFPPVVASGPNSAFPHAVPTDRRLQMKESIILDAGVRLKGYCSDITRTVFMGEPSPDLKAMYITVRQAQLSALDVIKPLVESTLVDGVARKIIGDAGFGGYFGHGLGHGVGLAVHERPRLGPKNPVKLKKGAVVTVEPGIYIPGTGGVRLEEMVAIEDSGPRILTKNNHFYDFGS